MKLYLILFLLCVLGFEKQSLAGPNVLLLEDQTPEAAEASATEASRKKLFETDDIVWHISQMDPGVVFQFIQGTYYRDVGAAAIKSYKNKIVKLVKACKFTEIPDDNVPHWISKNASYQVSMHWISRELWQAVMGGKPSHLYENEENTWDSDLRRPVTFLPFGDTKEEKRALEKLNREIKAFENKLNQIMAGRGCVYFTETRCPSGSGDVFFLDLLRRCF